VIFMPDAETAGDYAAVIGPAPANECSALRGLGGQSGGSRPGPSQWFRTLHEPISDRRDFLAEFGSLGSSSLANITMNMQL
jgi:hypothetical protein